MMLRPPIALVVIAVLLGLPAIGESPAPEAVETAPLTITLHDEALVAGGTIMLGDLASVSGDSADTLASLEINPAPVPGNSKNLTAALIEARIRNAGVEPGAYELLGPSVIKATRLHQTLDHRRISEELESHILLEMPWDPALTVVDLLVPEQELTLPQGAIEFAWQTNPRYGYLGMGTFKLDVMVDGERQRSVLCRASIETYGEAAVATTQIPRGQIVSDHHIRMERYALSNMPPGAYQSVDEVSGLVARTTIMPGQVVTQRRVEPRTLVKRRQLVTVESRVGALAVTTEARAMSDGKAGDIIELTNTASDQAFTGMVRADGRIVVQ